MPTDPSVILNELGERVKKLEDVIFPPSGGGGTPTAVESRLAKIEEDLKSLDVRSGKKWSEIDEQINKIVRIVAELREIVAKQAKTGVTRKMTASG